MPDAVGIVGDERALLKELQQLRRGHGLHARDLESRIGPRLSRLAGLEPGMSAGTKRLRLSEYITQQVLTLPEDLRIALQAAYALPPASESRFLRERMEWLGARLDRDARTAGRRVESGLELLAERLLSRAEPADAANPGTEAVYAPDGWYVDSFQAALMMHVDPVQVLETRRICATAEELELIAVSWSIPADTLESAAAIDVDILYGGELLKDEASSTRTFWSGHVRPPRPLRRGERHEFQVRVGSVPQRLLRPYFVLSPFRRCDEFVLRAKFDRRSAPAQVWRLDGVPYAYIDEEQPVGEVLDLDAVSEVAEGSRTSGKD